MVEYIQNYKFERYQTAYLDYKTASEAFYAAVCTRSRNNADTSEAVEQSARALFIKHLHFIECANRLLQGCNAASVSQVPEPATYIAYG